VLVKDYLVFFAKCFFCKNRLTVSSEAAL